MGSEKDSRRKKPAKPKIAPIAMFTVKNDFFIPFILARKESENKPLRLSCFKLKRLVSLLETRNLAFSAPSKNKPGASDRKSPD